MVCGLAVGSAGSDSLAHRAAVVLASLLPAGFGRSQNPRDVGERLQSASDVLLVACSACDSVHEHKPRCWNLISKAHEARLDPDQP